MFSANRVVLFTSDRGYLVPTLVAARQVASQRRQAEQFDVLILLLGFSWEELEALKGEFSPYGLVFERMEHDLFDHGLELHFEKSHVPTSAMARLSSAPYLARRHKQVIYLDGDIQVRGDIGRMLAHDVPDGRILAAADRYIISKSTTGYSGQLWRAGRAYLDGLKIDDPAEYFNSGVLMASTKAWAEICANALDFYRANSALCLYHDQSALNVVSRGRRDVLSPRYNYTTSFALAAGVSAYDPAVTHFTGSDKPWLFTNRPPWNGYGQPYRTILHDHPILLPYASDWGAKQAAMGPDAPPPIPPASALSNTLRAHQRRMRLDGYMKRHTFAF